MLYRLLNKPIRRKGFESKIAFIKPMESAVLRSYVDWQQVPNKAFYLPLAVELVISLSTMLSYAFVVPKDK